MGKEVFDLSELIDDGETDSISGRSFGEGYAHRKHLMEKLESGAIIVLDIDPQKIKAINDSFLKGFFSAVFKKYKTIDNVRKHFEFKTDEYFIALIEKNLSILHAIENS